MRKILLAALVAVAAAQAAPAANAACAENHGATVHVHSTTCPKPHPPGCTPETCPDSLISCALIPDVYVTTGVGFECE